MVTSFFKAFGVILVGILFVFTPVSAQQDQPISTQSAPVEMNMPTQSARIEQYKERVLERIDTLRASRIVSRCRAAQVKIAALQQSSAMRNEERVLAYNRVTAALDTMTTKLQNLSINIESFQALVVNVQTKISDTTMLLDEYEILLTDLAQLDCEGDPDAFQAALFLARDARFDLKDKTQEIRTLLQNDIKKNLDVLREEIVSNTSQSEEQ
jgi:hypothetical protein